MKRASEYLRRRGRHRTLGRQSAGAGMRSVAESVHAGGGEWMHPPVRAHVERLVVIHTRVCGGPPATNAEERCLSLTVKHGFRTGTCHARTQQSGSSFTPVDRACGSGPGSRSAAHERQTVRPPDKHQHSRHLCAASPTQPRLVTMGPARGGRVSSKLRASTEARSHRVGGGLSISVSCSTLVDGLARSR